MGFGGPQWGPVELMCLYLCISVFLYLYPVLRINFWWSKCVVRNCAQRMWPQATGSNPPSGSIICPSIRSSTGLLGFLYLYSIVLIIHMINITIIINSVGFQSRDAFPHTGVQSILYVRMYLCLSVRLSSLLFGDHSHGPWLRTAHVAAGHGLNSLIGSIIFLSVRPSVFLYIFLSVCPSVRSSAGLFQFLYLY